MPGDDEPELVSSVAGPPSAATSSTSAKKSADPMQTLKARAAATAAEKEKFAKERAERVKAGIEEARRKRKAQERAEAEAAAAKKGKSAADDLLESLYGGLPEPDPSKDSLQAAKVKEQERWRSHRFPALPAEDPTKVIFLDIDGVLRPLTAGGFRSMMVDGEWALRAETADFISGALLSLRHIVENTGAIIVLSSEWRRDLPMREGVDKALEEYEMRACATWTPTDLQRDMGTENPFKAFTERRAREISTWLSNNPQVKQWVVIDDINMADADLDRKPGTLLMAPRIVQTHRKIGLTMEQARAAIQLLRGEKLPPQILSVQPHVELTG